MEKWSTDIKPKVIAQSRDLTQTEEVQYLIQNAVATEVEEGTYNGPVISMELINYWEIKGTADV